jgi:hypothetical protein
MRLPRGTELATEAGEQSVGCIVGQPDRVNNARVRRQRSPRSGRRLPRSRRAVDEGLDKIGNLVKLSTCHHVRARDAGRCSLGQTPRLGLELVASQRIDREADHNPT